MKMTQFFSHYGPGGRHCNCCGPSPKERAKFDRTAKRRELQFVKKEIVKELKPD